jgi:aspartyl-tRNA(Asn)/glutamyl-tRNA(Gln) amidotransferase subunit C
MAVSEHDVRHIAQLARLGLTDERIPALVGELNRILEHMAVLQQTDVANAQAAIGVGDGGMPLRADKGPPYELARDISSFAPSVRDGFLLVPRLSTHEQVGEESVVMDAGENVIAESVLRETEEDA